MTTLPTLSPSFDWRAEKIDWPVTTEVGRGLSGVIATTTEVMWLDPASGSLAYRGVPVETLADRNSFEETASLLITGSMPAKTIRRDIPPFAANSVPAAFCLRMSPV